MSSAPVLLTPSMLPPGDPRHGLNGYSNLRCRCDTCRNAHRLRHADWKARHKGTLGPGDPRHGTTLGYDQYGCRCDDCRASRGYAGPPLTVDLEQHGTYPRYQRHRRDGETPCTDCRAASAAYQRDLRARRRDAT